MHAKCGDMKIWIWSKKYTMNSFEKLPVQKRTPIYMLLAELGRFPLQIVIKARMIGFWNRLIKGKESKLSLIVYKCLLYSSMSSKWLQHSQNILVEVGRPDIWYSQQSISTVSLSTLIKNILMRPSKRGYLFPCSPRKNDLVPPKKKSWFFMFPITQNCLCSLVPLTF